MEDYRGDCWKGYKDVRMRLRTAKVGDTIQFICDTDTAGRMARVIIFNDGKIVAKEITPGGTIMTVTKVWIAHGTLINPWLIPDYELLRKNLVFQKMRMYNI